MFERIDNIKGQRFGMLTALHPTTKKGKHAVWMFQCDCGNYKEISARSVKSKVAPTHSCGCKAHATSPEYRAWRGMLRRCHDPNAHNYSRYGARGITVCDQWRKNFPAFLEQIGPRPCPELSVDRIDNEKGYEPGNVRWATKSDQVNNMRKSLRVGMRFGMLETVRRDESQGKHAKWIVKCDCGNEASVRADNLKSGRQAACGCQRRKGAKL